MNRQAGHLHHLRCLDSNQSRPPDGRNQLFVHRWTEKLRTKEKYMYVKAWMKNSTLNQGKTGGEMRWVKNLKPRTSSFITQAKDGAGESFYLYGRYFKKTKTKTKKQKKIGVLAFDDDARSRKWAGSAGFESKKKKKWSTGALLPRCGVPRGKGHEVAYPSPPPFPLIPVWSVWAYERATEGTRAGKQATEAASAPLRSQGPCA